MAIDYSEERAVLKSLVTIYFSYINGVLDVLEF